MRNYGKVAQRESTRLKTVGSRVRVPPFPFLKGKMNKKINTAVLFSGGKDSCMALQHALQSTNVQCLITITSENPASYMFHTPNIHIAETQAKAIGLPIIKKTTKGQKEEELKDLEKAIQEAIKKYKIEGIVTGALASLYQSSRIQKICDKLNLVCLNPLWQKDQIEFLKELINQKFEVIVIGTFAEGLENFIGRKIDDKFIEDIQKVVKKYKINPAGEGGELETLTLDAPFFKKRLNIEKSHIETDSTGSKVLVIEKISLNNK